jgi:hypothetical protein
MVAAHPSVTVTRLAERWLDLILSSANHLRRLRPPPQTPGRHGTTLDWLNPNPRQGSGLLLRARLHGEGLGFHHQLFCIVMHLFSCVID